MNFLFLPESLRATLKDFLVARMAFLMFLILNFADLCIFLHSFLARTALLLACLAFMRTIALMTALAFFIVVWAFLETVKNLRTDRAFIANLIAFLEAFLEIFLEAFLIGFLISFLTTLTFLTAALALTASLATGFTGG